ncbi:hypothetical protein DL96DRAFT_1021869 [Flagelloscypha sp. PMI_526]|nr:hypothetical protein DL96DRAFT_1021869 [Flagelloscypha sp. PMI_526]
MPHLRVLAGSSLDALQPISDIINCGKSCKVSNRFFEGELSASIRDFINEEGEKVPNGPYFGQPGKDSITWSIVTKGRFLVPINADDVLFGNTFDRPLKLPWGTSAALKFASYIDPTLEHDLSSTTKPWALSPLISTMPNLRHRRESWEEATEDPFPPKVAIQDSTSQLHLARISRTESGRHSRASSIASSIDDLDDPDTPTQAKILKKSKSKSSLYKLKKVSRSVTSLMSNKSGHSSISEDDEGAYNFASASQRRKFFADAEARKDVIFGPEDIILTDFCYGFFSFSPTIALQIPGGIEFDLMHYWDRQPVRFVCCARKGWDPDEEKENTPWGTVFWCMALEVVDD